MYIITYIFEFVKNLPVHIRLIGSAGTEKKNVTQAELAENIGVSQAFVSYMLGGYKTPSVATLKSIADYLGVTVDELIN